MPKYAILSDIHSNLEALDVVLEKCRSFGPDLKYICLGDIVGYNANPHECMEKVRALNCVSIVQGNHDHYMSDEKGVDGFNPRAKAAVEWTKLQLSDEERDYLGNLPMRATIPGTNITLVHATLDSPDNWGYVFDLYHAVSSLSYQFTQTGFCGHSHVPVAFEKRPNTSSDTAVVELEEWNASHVDGTIEEVFLQEDVSTIKLEIAHKYFFNIGSIGQPRNHDPRASFALYDTDAMTVSRYRLPYDIATAQQKVLEAGLPEQLARRLAFGV